MGGGGAIFPFFFFERTFFYETIRKNQFQENRHDQFLTL